MVDNGSKDGTFSWVKENFPHFSVLLLPFNKGFSYAMNRGIEMSQGKWLIALNSDVLLHPEFLCRLKEFLDSLKDPRVGMVQPKILYPDGKTIYSTGLLLSPARRFFNRGQGLKDGEKKIEGKILGPCGAAGVYKREMLEEIRFGEEYFDETFFFLGEDFDLAWRGRRKGWKVVYVPQAICYHVGEVTHSRKFRQYLSFRNRYYLLLKNEKISSLLNSLLPLLIYELLRIPYLLISNPYTWKAFLEIKRNYHQLMKKRSA